MQHRVCFGATTVLVCMAKILPSIMPICLYLTGHIAEVMCSQCCPGQLSLFSNNSELSAPNSYVQNITPCLVGSSIHTDNLINIESLLDFLGLITPVSSGWPSSSSIFQVIGPSNSSKFSKFMRLFGQIGEPMSQGVTFWT